MTSQPKALTPDELQHGLAGCPNWTVVTSPLPDEPQTMQTELRRSFRFATFNQAMAFMQAAIPFIDEINHHPRWENAHRNVTVWLSTWDIGHAVSNLDFDLARHLDALAERLNEPPA